MNLATPQRSVDAPPAWHVSRRKVTPALLARGAALLDLEQDPDEALELNGSTIEPSNLESFGTTAVGPTGHCISYDSAPSALHRQRQRCGVRAFSSEGKCVDRRR
jgi:hypothetical protein